MNLEKLPKWAQEHIRSMVIKIERLEKEKAASGRQVERYSGELQEALDTLWAIAETGDAGIAVTAKANWDEGRPLRNGHTNY
jgi:hypothetical protein